MNALAIDTLRAVHRAAYSDSIAAFLLRNADEIIGVLVGNSRFSVETTQRDAWLEQISILKRMLESYSGRGSVYFEYDVPRLGKRIDVVLIIDHVLFVLGPV